LIVLRHGAPSNAQQNAFIESFIGRLRDKMLNEALFRCSLTPASLTGSGTNREDKSPREGDHLRKVGRLSFAITPMESHREMCSSFRRFRFSYCMAFWYGGIRAGKFCGWA